MPHTTPRSFYFFTPFPSTEEQQKIIFNTEDARCQTKFERDFLQRDIYSFQGMHDSLGKALPKKKAALTKILSKTKTNLFTKTTRTLQLLDTTGYKQFGKKLQKNTLYTFINTYHQDRLSFEGCEHIQWELAAYYHQTYGQSIQTWQGVFSQILHARKFVLTLPGKDSIQITMTIHITDAIIKKMDEFLECNDALMKIKQEHPTLLSTLEKANIVSTLTYSKKFENNLKIENTHTFPENIDLPDLCTTYSARACRVGQFKASTLKHIQTKSNFKEPFKNIQVDFFKTLCKRAANKYLTFIKEPKNRTFLQDIIRSHTGLGKERCKTLIQKLPTCDIFLAVLNLLGGFFNGSDKIISPDASLNRKAKNRLVRPGTGDNSFIAFFLNELKKYSHIVEAINTECKCQTALTLNRSINYRNKENTTAIHAREAWRNMLMEYGKEKQDENNLHNPITRFLKLN